MADLHLTAAVLVALHGGQKTMRRLKRV